MRLAPPPAPVSCGAASSAAGAAASPVAPSRRWMNPRRSLERAITSSLSERLRDRLLRQRRHDGVPLRVGMQAVAGELRSQKPFAVEHRRVVVEIYVVVLLGRRADPRVQLLDLLR